jgi:hypothetical protein
MGNQLKLAGAASVVDLFLGSEKTLDLGALTDLSAIIVGDIFEDNLGQLLYVVDVQNSSFPHRLTIKDSDNNFAAGAWRILSSNASYLTARVERDGKVIGSSAAFRTLIGDVDLSYGSLTW